MEITTLEGPIVLFAENFSDCNNLMFVTYNKASDKNWGCQTLFGGNNSGSMEINEYQENTASKDWLITKNAINFDNSTGEKLSVYTDAKYGTTTLDLVYSSDYNGSGNPVNFTWNSAPNLATITHTSETSEAVYNLILVLFQEPFTWLLILL